MRFFYYRVRQRRVRRVCAQMVAIRHTETYVPFVLTPPLFQDLKLTPVYTESNNFFGHKVVNNLGTELYKEIAGIFEPTPKRIRKCTECVSFLSGILVRRGHVE